MQSVDVEFSLMMTFQLLLAIILALPTAYNREKSDRMMGLRTFPLVSMGSCAYVLVAQGFIPADSPGAMARIMQGLMSGIGFVGGGAILKSDDRVRGTASAASIWITGACGAAVGLQQWGIAVSLSLLNFLVIWLLSFVKEDVHSDDENFKCD